MGVGTLDKGAFLLLKSLHPQSLNQCHYVERVESLYLSCNLYHAYIFLNIYDSDPFIRYSMENRQPMVQSGYINWFKLVFLTLARSGFVIGGDRLMSERMY